MYAYILCMHMERENIDFKTKKHCGIRNKKLTLLNKNNHSISSGEERRNYLKAEFTENEVPSAPLLPTHITLWNFLPACANQVYFLKS